MGAPGRRPGTQARRRSLTAPLGEGRSSSLILAGGLALLLAGRVALGQNESPPGFLFYTVAPVAFIAGAVISFVGILRLRGVWRAPAALLTALLVGAFAVSPGTDDGELAVLFMLYGLLLLVASLFFARKSRQEIPTTPAGRTHDRAVSRATVAVAIAGIVLVVGVLLFLLVFILVIAPELGES